MPDADDFDVEYFRALLKGSNPEKEHAAPAKLALPAAKKRARPAAKRAAAKDACKPAGARKRRKE